MYTLHRWISHIRVMIYFILVSFWKPRVGLRKGVRLVQSMIIVLTECNWYGQLLVSDIRASPRPLIRIFRVKIQNVEGSALVWSHLLFSDKLNRVSQAQIILWVFPVGTLDLTSWCALKGYFLFFFLCTLVSLFLREQERSRCGGQLRESVCTKLSLFWACINFKFIFSCQVQIAICNCFSMCFERWVHCEMSGL